MFSLSPLFSDHAVLQRDHPVFIWGKFSEEVPQESVLVISLFDFREGASGIEISRQNGLFASDITHDRKSDWESYLTPQPAGGPYEMVVSLEMPSKATPLFVLRIKDICFGDVYLLAGQSNIDFRLSMDCEFQEGNLEGLDNTQIRTFRVPRIDYKGAEPEINPDNNTWSFLSKETAGNFPAIAYYFAVRMHAHIGVPIGCIDVCRGGTSASVWVDESCLRDDPDLRLYLDEYNALLEHLDIEKNKKDHEAYYENLAVYNERAARYREKRLTEVQIERRLGTFPWPPPSGPYSYRSPCGLFHTMLEPCIPYEISAVLFYQGEEDVVRFQLYNKLLRTLITYWRDRWKIPELPFFLVQIAPYDDPQNNGLEAAYLKETQSLIAAEVPRVTIVITTDCGEANDIHPKSKRKIGDRLFRQACRYILGEDIIADSPVMKSYEIRGNTIDIEFETYGSALQAGIDGRSERLVGFFLAAEDGVFHPADAVLLDCHVLLTCRQTPMPRFARYAFGKFVQSNLYNDAGLPAVPFRTR